MTKKLIPLYILLALGMFSCKERLNRINYTKPVLTNPSDYFKIDSTSTETVGTTGFPQNVLIEDFTGVTCPNCPTAHEYAADWIHKDTGRVFMIAYHFHDDGFSQSKPAPESKFDLRTKEGSDMKDYLGGLEGLPAWAINRRMLAPGKFTNINVKAYQNNVGSELKLKSHAGINIVSATYNPLDSAFTSTIKIQYDTASVDSDYVSIAFIQSNITDAQIKTGSGTVLEYVHNNIHRMYISPLDGLKIPGPIKAGSTYYVKFRQTIPKLEKDPTWQTKDLPLWKAANMKMVVILHRQSPTNKKVIQVMESKFN